MSPSDPDSTNDPAEEQQGKPAGKQAGDARTAKLGTGTGTGTAGAMSSLPGTSTGAGRNVSGEPATDANRTGEEERRKAAGDGIRADWKLFRAAVALVGLLLLGFGVFQVLTGTAGLPEATSEVNATLESNYRFFAALLVGVGAAFLTIAVKFEWANVLWFVCAMVFIGGIARVISWALSGTPHVIMILLMVLELVIPPLLVVWHRWVAKTAELKRMYSHGESSPEDKH